MKFLVLLACLVALASAAPRSRSYKSRVAVQERRLYVDPLPSAPRHTPRIVGGEPAEPNEFPHQVGVFIDGSGFCGGSLISPNWVLTAGHCVQGARSWEVRAGAHYIQGINADHEESKTTTVAKLHENYIAAVIRNDIALLYFADPFDFETTGNVGAVKLADQESDAQPGDTVTASGWGRPSDSDPGISNVLRKVDVEVITNALCAQTYGSAIVTAGNICTDATGGQGTCNGDSGGPLTTLEGDEYVTYGITSFGSSAGCESGAPAAFSRVAFFRDWIRTNSGV
jgi:secreted trypsin-like serine protease